MSIFEPDYSMTDPGTPGWEQAPIPWWGQNPMAAGPRRVGVGTMDANSDLPVLQDWGVVPDVTGVEQTVARYQPSPPPSYALALGQNSCGCGGVGQDAEQRYKQVSWGHVAAAAAVGIFFGLIIGWTAGKRSKKMKSNRRSRRRSYYAPNRRGGKIQGLRGRALTPTARKRLPDSAFVFPERRSFPIHDEYHAVKALQYAKWPQHRARRSDVLRAVGKEWGHDPEVAEKAYDYFPRSASKYGFSKRAAARAA